MRHQPTIMPVNDWLNPTPALWERSLYRLLAWLSPAFPVGAFSFSHGLEAAAESRLVRDRTSLQNWIAAVVVFGTGRIDVDILCDAHRAAAADDIEALTLANRRGAAFRATAEMAVETTAQGAAFLDTCRASWPEPFLDRWAGVLKGDPICYAAVIGAATARVGIPLLWAVSAYLQAMEIQGNLCRCDRF